MFEAGALTPDPYILFLLGLGALVILVSWGPAGLKRLPVSLAILCVAIGYGVFSLGWLAFNPDPRTFDTVTERMAELVVIVSLMGAGLKLDRRLGWKAWGATWRLLAIAMPLTIALVAWLGVGALGFSLPMALLLGASLAPTDPVLAADVQTGPPGSGENSEVRFHLTAEAGLNDALAFPFVNLAIVAAAGGLALGPQLAEWALVDVVWKLAAGLGMGVLVGRGLGWLMFSGRPNALAGVADGLVALGATLLAYALTEVVHGYGFLAVFVAALTIRNAEREHDYHRELHDFAEQVEKLLMLLLLVLFGGAIANGLFDALTWTDGLVALAILLLVRPLAGYASLFGTGLKRREKAAIAFFGIRGIGTVYYVAYGLNHGDFGSSERLWAVVGLVILGSIVLHGVSSTPLLRLAERR
ncbi:MAG TPA: cation:proton antiporter [Brevundimonas sp.]|uniref:cation:proton antiporter n=1 Tax=Brevundimonas sp. TaxID=1871086 RepID=UPI002E16015B|nr:cation:proton antiporter [Brevundimonas sp.]